MRVLLKDSPRHLATIHVRTWIHLRVISGNVRIARENQELLGGAGLPVLTSDGIVSLNWQTGSIWAQGSGGDAELEIVLP